MAESNFKRRLAQIIIAVVCVGGMLGGVLWANISAYQKWSSVTALENHGKSVQATVVSTTDINSGKRKSYFLTLSYEAINRQGESVPMEEELAVDSYYYSLYTEGDRVEVVYLAESPEKLNIPGNEAYIEDILLVVGANLLLLVCAIVVFRMWRKEQKKRETAGPASTL